MTQQVMTCPSCGSQHLDRDEVDIGVGTQVGPWGCFDCGWTEGKDLPEVVTPESWQRERDALKADLLMLRSALVGLIGVDGRAELDALEAQMRLLPAPAADKSVSIDAIHALLATLRVEDEGGDRD